MPITGCITLEVEAESRAAAEEAFYDKVSDVSTEDLDMEWEFTPHVTTGNVTRAHTNDMYIEELKK